jgi:hypothetical protein
MRNRLLFPVAAALTLTVIAPAEASHHALAYKGKLGHRGAIRIDLAGSRARVYFDARCKEKERSEEEEVGTHPIPAAGYAAEVSYEPVSGRVRAGGLSIDDEVNLGETNDELSQAPVAAVRLHARVTSRRITGVFSLDQAHAGGISPGEDTGVSACSTGNVRFTARR